MPASHKKVLPVLFSEAAHYGQMFQVFFLLKLLSIAGRLAKYAPRAALEKSKDLYPGPLWRQT